MGSRILSVNLIRTHNPGMDNLSPEQRGKMEKWKGKYLMTSWENYADFLEKLGVPLLLRKLATMGTPIVEVTYDEETEVWNVSRTSTLFYQLIKLRSVDFKFRLDEEFDEVTPDKREGTSIVTVEGDTVVTEFKGHECTRYMTIEKNPDCVGVMKFRRMVAGKVLEATEVQNLEEFESANHIAKMVITD